MEIYFYSCKIDCKENIKVECSSENCDALSSMIAKYDANGNFSFVDNIQSPNLKDEDTDYMPNKCKLVFVCSDCSSLRVLDAEKIVQSNQCLTNIDCVPCILDDKINLASNMIRITVCSYST